MMSSSFALLLLLLLAANMIVVAQTTEFTMWTKSPTDVTSGSCGFVSLSVGGESSFPRMPYVASGSYCAVSSDLYRTGAACGSCYRLTYDGSDGNTDPGKAGSVDVQVVDSGAGRTDHFDCYLPAFELLTGASTGVFTVGTFYERIACDAVTGNARVVLESSNADGYWCRLVPQNVGGAGTVDGMEMVTSGGLTIVGTRTEFSGAMFAFSASDAGCNNVPKTITLTQTGLDGTKKEITLKCDKEGSPNEEKTDWTVGGSGCSSDVNFGEEASCVNPITGETSTVVDCFADPCKVTNCTNHPQSDCIPNYCGGCHALFYPVGGGNRLTDCDTTVAPTPVPTFMPSSAPAASKVVSPKCPSGEPELPNFFCGRGATQSCPDNYYCEIHPTDLYAVCCPNEGDGNNKVGNSTMSSGPSFIPSSVPSEAPPTHAPSDGPSHIPSRAPSMPSLNPSRLPTGVPYNAPSDRPTKEEASPPPTNVPSSVPSYVPSSQPSAPSNSPSKRPAILPGDGLPSDLPSPRPSPFPSGTPSSSRALTSAPSEDPTSLTAVPSSLPSGVAPSESPSDVPTDDPPAVAPSRAPSFDPSHSPVDAANSTAATPTGPSASPSVAPSIKPSAVDTAPTPPFQVDPLQNLGSTSAASSNRLGGIIAAAMWPTFLSIVVRWVK